MINLLPQSEKEELAKETKWRLIMILGILALSSLICFSLILFSIEIFVSSQTEVQRITVSAQEKEFEASQPKELQERIKLYNVKLGELKNFYGKQVKFTSLIEKISKTLPFGLRLDAISISPAKESGFNCILSGFAQGQNDLLQFKENLGKEKGFSNVQFPLSAWIEQENIDFSVTFDITP